MTEYTVEIEYFKGDNKAIEGLSYEEASAKFQKCLVDPNCSYAAISSGQDIMYSWYAPAEKRVSNKVKEIMDK